MLVSEPHRHGEAAVEIIGVRPILIWWSWGELNPRPKALPQNFLRAQWVMVRLPAIPFPEASPHACRVG